MTTLYIYIYIYIYIYVQVAISDPRIHNTQSVQTVHHVSKHMSCHKTIVVITIEDTLFSCLHIYIYIYIYVYMHVIYMYICNVGIYIYI